ncbi:hypothetical protein Tco_0729056 [Tanacetum coccineum]|uniref:Uncharacterized protein n=1 Tax=Tanacetum coccineum TaxID=301880 RepID=A0ABQ4YNQ8_9ASTR
MNNYCSFVFPNSPPLIYIQGANRNEGYKGTIRVTRTDMAENYITKPSHWPIPIKEAHVDFEEAQVKDRFYTKLLTKETQTSHQWNDTLAIFRCPQLNPTATIEAQMIERMMVSESLDSKGKRLEGSKAAYK